MTEPRDDARDEDLDPEISDADGIDDESNDVDGEADVDDLESDDLDDIDDEVGEADAAEIDDYEAALREVAGEAVPPTATTTVERRTSAARRRTPGKQPTRAPSPSEIAVHVRENVSRAFVIAAVAIYILILLNAIFLGTGGIFRPLPTATPTPSESPSASPSGSGSSSPATSPSASSSPSAGASPSAS